MDILPTGESIFALELLFLLIISLGDSTTQESVTGTVDIERYRTLKLPLIWSAHVKRVYERWRNEEGCHCERL